MFQEERVTNVHALLGEIGTFLDGAPAKKTGPMDWERFSGNKKRAQDSLDSLRYLFSTNREILAGCTDENPKYPKIMSIETEKVAGCSADNPQIPKIMLMETEKVAGCSADNPKIPR